MKSMNQKFMILLVLAVGSSQMKADHHDHDMCPSHKEHQDIHRIEKDINHIQKNIEKNGASEKIYRQLGELDEQAKNLCESCHKENSHMCNKHERTLQNKIKKARTLADKNKKDKQKEVKKNKKDKKDKQNVKAQRLVEGAVMHSQN